MLKTWMGMLMITISSLAPIGCDGVDDQDDENAIVIDDESVLDVKDAQDADKTVEHPAEGPEDISAILPDPVEGWCCTSSTCSGNQCSGCVVKPSASWCGSDQTWVDCSSYRQVGDTVYCL